MFAHVKLHFNSRSTCSLAQWYSAQSVVSQPWNHHLISPLDHQVPSYHQMPSNKRTSHIASHGYCNINIWDISNQLTMLTICFHVYSISLFHDTNGILINLRLCLCSGRIAFKYIWCQMFSQCLRYLTTAWIMNTDKCDFFLIHEMGTSP